MPTTVPSAFMVTDVLLLLNDLLDKKLFPVNPNESLMQKAAEEAVKIKRLMQALRYLFRASGSIADWFMKAGSMLCFVSKHPEGTKVWTMWRNSVVVLLGQNSPPKAQLQTKESLNKQQI